MIDESVPWLLCVLRPRLALSWLVDDIGPGFVADGDLFEAVSDDDLSAFYDRLYSAGGSFVGLQILPLAAPELPKQMRVLSYIRSANEDKQLRVFFAADVPDNVKTIHDQAFGGRIYRSIGGDVALSVDTFFLADAERRDIQSADVDWLSVRSIGTTCDPD